MRLRWRRRNRTTEGAEGKEENHRGHREHRGRGEENRTTKSTKGTKGEEKKKGCGEQGSGAWAEVKVKLGEGRMRARREETTTHLRPLSTITKCV